MMNDRLIFACEVNDFDQVELLLSEGTDPNVTDKDKKISPLYAATAEGHVKIVELLLKYGAEPNKCGFHGFIPLQVAAEVGDVKIAELLLAYGADPNLIANETTPLEMAVCQNHVDMVKLLLKHHANSHLVRVKTHEAYLSTAVRRGSVEIVELLLKHGVNPNLIDEYTNRTIFHEAIFTGSVKILELLLMYGRHFPNEKKGEAAIDIKDEWGHTALDIALYDISNKNLEIIVLLLKHGACIYSPRSLFEFLMTCDPRDPDVLYAFSVLQEQHKNHLPRLEISVIQCLNEDDVKNLKQNYKMLFRVSKKLEVKNNLLNKIFPNPIVDIIRKLDTPLSRLRCSARLFSIPDKDKAKKQWDEIAQSDRFIPECNIL